MPNLISHLKTLELSGQQGDVQLPRRCRERLECLEAALRRIMARTDPPDEDYYDAFHALTADDPYALARLPDYFPARCPNCTSIQLATTCSKGVALAVCVECAWTQTHEELQKAEREKLDAAASRHGGSVAIGD